MVAAAEVAVAKVGDVTVASVTEGGGVEAEDWAEKVEAVAMAVEGMTVEVEMADVQEEPVTVVASVAH